MGSLPALIPSISLPFRNSWIISAFISQSRIPENFRKIQFTFEERFIFLSSAMTKVKVFFPVMPHEVSNGTSD